MTTILSWSRSINEGVSFSNFGKKLQVRKSKEDFKKRICLRLVKYISCKDIECYHMRSAIAAKTIKNILSTLIDKEKMCCLAFQIFISLLPLLSLRMNDYACSSPGPRTSLKGMRPSSPVFILLSLIRLLRIGSTDKIEPIHSRGSYVRTLCFCWGKLKGLGENEYSRWKKVWTCIILILGGVVGVEKSRENEEG